MFKEVIYSSHTIRDGRPYRTVYPVYPGSPSFCKTAEAGDLDVTIKDFIAKLTPDPEFIYVVAVAMGAGESWSSNVNGDYFSRKDLVANHHHFVKNGRVYHLHDNTPNSKSYGAILFSHFNQVMDRVELVFTISRKDLPEVVAQIERGDNVDVSMGTKVEFDVCSICGKQSKRFSEYCAHLKYEMGRIYPDGRKVYADNPNPKFFDISIVDIGADRIAKVLMKVASQTKTLHSAAVAEKLSSHKESAMDKPPEGAVEKALPEKLKYYWEALGNKMEDCGLDIDMKDVSPNIDINDALGLFADKGVMLRPHEFTSFVMDRLGLGDMAEKIFSGREVLSSPASSDDVPLRISRSGELPIELPNRFSYDREISPNSMMLRFRMVAGGPVKSAGKTRSYAIKVASNRLETSLCSMYRSYVKQAAARVIKKANAELMSILPKIFASIIIGKALLEGNAATPEERAGARELFATINSTPSSVSLGSADVFGVPIAAISDELKISPSEMRAVMNKELDILEKIRRGGDPDKLAFNKVSSAILAPVQALASCHHYLKLAGAQSGPALTSDISRISPTATALLLSFKNVENLAV